MLTLVSCKKNEEKTNDVAVDVKETSKELVSEKKSIGYDIGDVATDFSLMNVNDSVYSLSNDKNAKGFIIAFTCNHCPFSVAYEDRLIEMDKKYKALGYPVVAINPNNPESYPTDSFENMKVRAEEKKFSFPYLFDDGQKIFPQYGATKTPHMYVLQKTDKGNIVKYIGAIDDNYQDANAVKNNYVQDAVDALLEGREIAVTKTKAIGCSIKQ